MSRSLLCCLPLVGVCFSALFVLCFMYIGPLGRLAILVDVGKITKQTVKLGGCLVLPQCSLAGLPQLLFVLKNGTSGGLRPSFLKILKIKRSIYLYKVCIKYSGALCA